MRKRAEGINGFGADYNTDAKRLNRGEAPMGRKPIYYTYASDLGLPWRWVITKNPSPNGDGSRARRLLQPGLYVTSRSKTE